tara:strand:- start:600 stop:1247 length:648 start_codon:yes stop_codon:yes gene_type:complete
MIDFLLMDENILFTTSLGIVGALSVLECLSFFCGFLLSGALDGIMPEYDLSMPENPIMIKLASTFCFGRVPFLIILIVFLTFFGSIGLFIQQYSMYNYDVILPQTQNATASFIIACILTSCFLRLIIKIIPSCCDSVSQSNLIGGIGTIITGHASQKEAAQAKITLNGKTYYIMVKPDTPLNTLQMGSKIMVSRLENSHYYAEPIGSIDKQAQTV